MALIDRLAEHSSRALARRTSRRGFLGVLGGALTGSLLLPLLPIARGQQAQAAMPEGGAGKDVDDPQSCDYWKYCAIDGALCACCGGTSHSCPPGTAQSPITWIGTCQNPHDKLDYMVSYNDCCGKTSCGNCACNRNEREKPIYRLARNNDVNWCMANADSNYHCSVSVVMGVAQK